MYEVVYLHELTEGFKADGVIGEWIGFYNTERPNWALAVTRRTKAPGHRLNNRSKT